MPVLDETALGGYYKSITTPEDLKELERLVSVFYSKAPMLNFWNKSPYGRNIFDEDFIEFIENAILKCDNKQKLKAPSSKLI